MFLCPTPPPVCSTDSPCAGDGSSGSSAGLPHHLWRLLLLLLPIVWKVWGQGAQVPQKTPECQVPRLDCHLPAGHLNGHVSGTQFYMAISIATVYSICLSPVLRQVCQCFIPSPTNTSIVYWKLLVYTALRMRPYWSGNGTVHYFIPPRAVLVLCLVSWATRRFLTALGALRTLLTPPYRMELTTSMIPST